MGKQDLSLTLGGTYPTWDLRSPGATSDTVGGLVGRNNGIVKRSFAAGAVTSTGASGGISGATVEGEEIKSYWSAAAQTKDAIDLAKLSGNQTGWSPDQPPVGDLIDYFCDSNGNGFIDPEERSPDNYVWDFGSSSEPPSIRCAAKAGAQQG